LRIVKAQILFVKRDIDHLHPFEVSLRVMSLAEPAGSPTSANTTAYYQPLKTEGQIRLDALVKGRVRKKVERTADDALICTLPSDTLKYIKARRKVDSFEKVPLTFFRERQLRNIFQGLDFDGMGTIHLDLVCDAADYAEEKLKPKKGKPVFVNIKQMFEAMDEDGDGTVDFHEFTIAMTGSSSSTIDTADEHDVDRLTKRFIEFADIRKRERALDHIDVDEEAPSTHHHFHKHKIDEFMDHEQQSDDNSDVFNKREDIPPLGLSTKAYDHDKIDHFLTCFSVFNDDRKEKGRQKSSELAKTSVTALSKELTTNEAAKIIDVEQPNFITRAQRTQDTLDALIEETMKSQYHGKVFTTATRDNEEQAKIDDEYYELQKQFKEQRFSTAENQNKDHDVVENERRVMAEKKFIDYVNSKCQSSVMGAKSSHSRPQLLLPVEKNATKRAIFAKVTARKDVAALKKKLNETGADKSEMNSNASSRRSSKNSVSSRKSSTRSISSHTSR
jgi:Ca2+-binding EF-hand superfamily protein